MPEKISFRDMEGEDLATTVLTCEGDIRDPTFPFKLQHLVNKLQRLISDEEKPFKVTKVEPWNSVRVTFNIPQEAAQRLRQLAERGDRVLRELGILSVQIEGDQVITLTLAGQFNEPQEIVLRKTTENQSNVTSVSFNLPSSEPVPGPSSVDPACKSISQFLGHIVGGATATAAAVTANPAVRVERPEVTSKPDAAISFKSPNVVAPTSSEPIPFLPTTSVAATVSGASTSRVPQNAPAKSQPGFGPFPFASMTHAMNTKHGGTSPQYQPMLHVQTTKPRLSFTSSSPPQFTTTARNPTSSSATSTVAVSPQPVSSPVLQKVPRTMANPIFNNIVSRVTTPNAVASTSRANVALSSPLLVNLLQSETSNVQQHNKLMPPPALASNQAPKRKRKPRKPKEKLFEDGGNLSSPTFSASPSPPSTPSSVGLRSPVGFDPLSVLGQSFSVPMPNIPLSPPNPQIPNLHPQAQGQPPVSNIHSHVQVQQATPNIHPQAQGQPPVSLHSQVQIQSTVPSNHRQIQGQQNVSTIHRQAQGHPQVPNIHPQAQGQPQVHTGNLPLHTHIPVGAPPVARPPTTLQSYAMSAPRGVSLNTSRLLFTPNRDTNIVKVAEKTNRDISFVKVPEKTCVTSTTPSTSTPDSNPFPSPPPSADGKTKHLINPFTGQLEPMPSDDEEEEESIGSLPPFPDFEIDTSENGQSERSLSDGGKDNNPSSDTDSGISKSHTDISQSSTECGPVESTKEVKKPEIVTKIENVTATASVTSGPGEKLKLRLKLDPKALRESKDSEMREKRIKETGSQFNQKIDVAVVSIPGLRKGGSVSGSSLNAPEPRVPPLHISLRGPNAAVVVSPRKDDSKSRHLCGKDDHSVTDTLIKSSQKKARSPRSARTTELSGVASLSNRTSESSEKKSKGNSLKEAKKGKEDFWNQNVKNMSGGGIVEMSDKLSVNRISSYETYLTNTAISSSSTVVQKKTPPSISTLAVIDSCKSDILTTCSPSVESANIHIVPNSKSQLTPQATLCSETESFVSVVTSQSQIKSMNTSVNLAHSLIERNSERTANNILSGIGNQCVQDKTLSDVQTVCSSSRQDNSVLGARKSPQNMQSNLILPHSPNAQVDNSNVQKFINPSDQIQTPPHQISSASSISVSSTVPMSSHSLCVSTQSVTTVAVSSTSELAAVSSTVLKPTVLNAFSDANRQSPVEKDKPKFVADMTSSATCDKLHQTNNQCNTSVLSNTSNKTVTNTVLVSSKDIVQSEKPFINTSSESVCNQDKSVIREVQINVAVNKEQTANNNDNSGNGINNIKETKEIIVKSDVVSPVSVKQTCNDDSQMCKNLVFSNHSDAHETTLTSCASIGRKEIIKEVADVSEKGLCIIEVKKPPIAQIITVDSLPLQSHVIEVPSLQTSPAMPKVLAKSGLAVEVSSIPSLIPSRGGTFLPTRNVVMMQEPSDILSVNDRTSPSLHNPRTLSSSNSEMFQKPSMPSSTDNEISLFNHVNIQEHETSECVSSDRTEQNSSAVPSEESSMDSIDEERKRCLQVSEIPTSTPGPPQANKDQKAVVVTPLSSVIKIDEIKDNISVEINNSLVKADNALSKISLPGTPNTQDEDHKQVTELLTDDKVEKSRTMKSQVNKGIWKSCDANFKLIVINLPTAEISRQSAIREGALGPGTSEERFTSTIVDETKNDNAVKTSSLTQVINTCESVLSDIPSTSYSKSSPLESSITEVPTDRTPQACISPSESSKKSECESSQPHGESDHSETCDTQITAILNKTDSLESTSKCDSNSTSEQIPTDDQVKTDNSNNSELPTVVCTSNSSVVTSLLSQGRYLSPETATGGRVRLIFKGSINSSSSGQHSVLSGTNSPTSVVVPLNTSKTVPIKLVTLPGGASGLSVRSTSNPAVVEIIGSKSASAHNSPSSGNPHSPSPVRLVVSKVSPGVSGGSQGGSSGVRNRVVVKSVVVTGTSSSIKIVSATKGAICTTTPISATSTVIATSTASGSSAISVPTSLSITSIQNPNLPSEVEVVQQNPSSSDGNSASNANSDDRTNSQNSNSREVLENSNNSCVLPPVGNSSTETLECSLTSNITSSSSVSETTGSSSSLSFFNNLSSNETNANRISVVSEQSSCEGEEKCVETFSQSEASNLNLENGPSANCASNENLQKSCPKENTEGDDNRVSSGIECHDVDEQNSDSAMTRCSQDISVEPESSGASDCNTGMDTVQCQNVEESTRNSNLNFASEDSCKEPCTDIIDCQSNQCLLEKNSVKKESHIEHVNVNKEQCAEEAQIVTEGGCNTNLNYNIKCSENVSELSLGTHSVQNEIVLSPREIIKSEDTTSETEQLDAIVSETIIEKQPIRPFKEPKNEIEEKCIGVLEQEIVESEELTKKVEQSDLDISLVYSKPLKRKCSENAAELIKACMGVEDNPKRVAMSKPKPTDDLPEKEGNEKFEADQMRMNLRVRRDDNNKKGKGPSANSDCSSDEEMSLSELVSKSRTRERPSRGRSCNRETSTEQNSCRSGRRRSGSNESHQGEEFKVRTSSRDIKREMKKEDTLKKIPERTKRGTGKGQDQLIVPRTGGQRSGRAKEQEIKPNIPSVKDENNSLLAKRKTRGAGVSEPVDLVPTKRRRYSKDGHR